MAKGQKTGGRKSGTPNKSTADVRAAIALIAQRNIDRVEQWLREVEDPAKRVALFLDLCEYHIPKLSRAELTGDGGKPIEVTVVRYSNTEPVGPASVPAKALGSS